MDVCKTQIWFLWICLISASKKKKRKSLNSSVLSQSRLPSSSQGHKHPLKEIKLERQPQPPGYLSQPCHSLWLSQRQVWSCLTAWPFDWWASPCWSSGPGLAFASWKHSVDPLPLHSTSEGRPSPSPCCQNPIPGPRSRYHLPRRKLWVIISY